MNFIFTCPEQNKTFETDRFSIRDNKGVTTDAAGNKTLDAAVVLTRPCPFCGQLHVYRANELACPF